MSNIKELIRAEIERQKKENMYVDLPMSIGRYYEDRELLSFLDTLPDEPVADCNEFEEAKEEYIRKARRTPGHEWMTHDIEDAFKAGAEWMKRKMMEGAVEGLICATITGTNAISFLSQLPKELTAGSEVRIIILPKED